jgi:predicted ATPase with chaperone activity
MALTKRPDKAYLTVSRAADSVTFPSEFMLVAAMHPATNPADA